MDSTVFQLTLQDRRIAYAITDHNFKVLEVGGLTDIFYYNDHARILGRLLLDVAPELFGSEAVLTDILAGNLPRFELDWVNREISSGQILYLTMVVLPHRNRAKQITGLLYLVEDVTEIGVLSQKLTQQRNELRLLRDQLTRRNLELAAANTELRRMDEVKSTFVSVAAHELRTPLASIKGFVELLLEEDHEPLTDGQREYLEAVQRGAQRLLNITNNLLDVTRIEAGRIELLLQPTDLLALVESVAAELKPLLEAKAHHLTLRTSPNLPLALCDETRAIQILGNLLNNACKYTPEAGLITLTLAPAGEVGFLQVTVADNGVGIPLEDQPNLFSPFFRAENVNSTGARGTGLGLYIIRSLVELHGGRIWFESKLNQGSTFHVTFPIAD